MTKLNLKLLTALLAVALVAGVTLFSCKKEETVKSQLKNELVLLNKSITLTPKPIDNSKGKLWDGIKKGLAIAGADVIGVGAGIYAGKEIVIIAGGASGGTGAIVAGTICGVIGGAGASIAAAAPMGGNNPNGNETINYSFTVDNSSHGYLHNKIVEQHYSINSLPLVDILNQANIQDAELVVALYESNEFQNFMENLLIAAEEYGRDFDIKKFMKKCGYISENLALVYDYLFQICSEIENEADILSVVQAYESFTTGNSLLSNDEKEILKSSLSITKYSPYYWASVINTDE